MSSLRLQAISKTFKGKADRPAVHDVSLEVPEGRVLAIVGESGSGKTTLLRMIAGLEIPDTGQIFISDELASTPSRVTPPERRGIGVVFQDGALFPHLTVARNVAYGLRHLPRPERAPRVAEMLELVGLSGLQDRYPREVSGGEAQRVALARALAASPRVLLLDEPFSNLDANLRKQLRDDVRTILHGTRTTSILSLIHI